METLHAFRTCICAACLVCITALRVADGQPIQFGMSRPASIQLSPPRVNAISGTIVSRLEQARALAKDENWDDAVDIFRELAAERSEAVVELGNGRYVSLRTACHLELARLPAEGLNAYRRRVDSLAERLYREGQVDRNERMLRRVVDEFFCSSLGDDALLALGELSLERGDYAAARRYWEQTSPLLRDPAGQPLWLALRDIDLAAHWPRIERRWRERPKPLAWLAYPDTGLDLADVRARGILASIRAGELKRAAIELEAFRRFHPDASGRLGGRDGPYAVVLERLMASAAEWPSQLPQADWLTFAGSLSRSSAATSLGPVTGPIWREPIELGRSAMANGNLPMASTSREYTLDESHNGGREAARPLSCFPVVVNGVVLYADAAGLYAADLMTGRPAITKTGVLHRENPVEQPGQAIAGRLPLGWREDLGAAYGVPRYTLSVIDGVVFGRVGRLTTTQIDARQSRRADRLVGLDLERDGALAFRVRPAEAKWAFDGVPVGDGRRLFVAMRQSDVTPHAYVACFDVATSKELWRTSVGAADTPAANYGDEVTHNLLTLVGDRIYFNTNLGLVAALDADSGEICWLRRYDRQSGPQTIGGGPGPPHFACDPAPCLYHNGLLIVAASDTPKIFALDADTGHTIWSTEVLPDGFHLLGVMGNHLIVSGNRLAALDVRSGVLRFVWPESEHAGIRGMGRGVVAGDEVFWPTRNEIYVIHGVTGAQSRTRIPLGAISDCGANLAAANGRLVVAGPDKLMAFGAALPVPPNQNKPKTERVAKTK